MATKLKLPAIDPSDVSPVTGSRYPEPFKSRVSARRKQRLGDALGLKNYGVNLTTIPPGAVSALRHWHSHEDEFIFVLEGEVVLVSDDGEQRLVAGDCAGFPAGKTDGHHLQNRSDRDAIVLEVGTSAPAVDVTTYPDIDMLALPEGFVHRDRTPYKR